LTLALVNQVLVINNSLKDLYAPPQALTIKNNLFIQYQLLYNYVNQLDGLVLLREMGGHMNDYNRLIGELILMPTNDGYDLLRKTNDFDITNLQLKARHDLGMS
jgi:hypothetical protein